MRRFLAISARVLALGFIAVLAVLLRVFRLERLSFWYDEVVTMTVARAESFREVIATLDRIDATRAPLHPLLLHVWVRVFGDSEFSGRGFSAVCGIITVAMVYRIARRLYDSQATAFFAAWLAAISPMLVVYSREARMYAWLVLLTCAAWDALFLLRSEDQSTRGRWARLLWYGLCLVALGYSHPLGLFMAIALAMAGAIDASSYGFKVGEWLIVHLGAATIVALWLRRYVDHPPELIMGMLPIRYLLGTPIGWTGGNFRTLAGCVLLLCVGLFSLRRRVVNGRKRRLALILEHPVAGRSLLVWLVVPVALLWVYSRAATRFSDRRGTPCFVPHPT